MWTYDFIQHAFVASIFASIACGVIGTYVVVKRMVFLTGGIAHTAFGGLGFAYLMRFNPFIGALGASWIATISMSLLRRFNYSEDTAMGILWPLGMSLGILFVSFSQGYVGDLFAYLFGNILMVSILDLWIMAILVAFLLLLVMVFFQELQALCFDEEFAKVRGLQTERFYLLLLFLISCSVVLLMKVVGIVLLLALLTIPAAMSRKWVVSLKANMVMASFLAFTFINVGIMASYYVDVPAGASIVLVACITFSLVQLFSWLGSA